MTANDIPTDELAEQAIKADRADRQRGVNMDAQEIDTRLAVIRDTLEETRHLYHEPTDGALADAAADAEAIRGWLADHVDQETLTADEEIRRMDGEEVGDG